MFVKERSKAAAFLWLLLIPGIIYINYLMFKLYMFKSSGRKFEIKLIIDDNEKIIDDNLIPDLKEKEIVVRKIFYIIF